MFPLRFQNIVYSLNQQTSNKYYNAYMENFGLMTSKRVNTTRDVINKLFMNALSTQVDCIHSEGTFS